MCPWKITFALFKWISTNPETCILMVFRKFNKSIKLISENIVCFLSYIMRNIKLNPSSRIKKCNQATSSPTDIAPRGSKRSSDDINFLFTCFVKKNCKQTDSSIHTTFFGWCLDVIIISDDLKYFINTFWGLVP